MSLNDSVGLLSHGTMGPVVAVVGALLETRASPSFSFGCPFQSFQMKRYVPSIKLSKSKKMKKKKMYSFFSIFSKKMKCGLRPLIVGLLRCRFRIRAKYVQFRGEKLTSSMRLGKSWPPQKLEKWVSVSQVCVYHISKMSSI